MNNNYFNCLILRDICFILKTYIASVTLYKYSTEEIIEGVYNELI